ncbi:MAG: insulinase family protein [Lachnospiraceae bacterium]|nr:insulinase family protein [Lachnospiraceae bacterium]
MNISEKFELKEKREVAELKSTGYLLSHKKTGARIFVLENEDDNKVFYIGFRTPPQDSRGVPHIMEHSVLCGSKKYPPKDPFVELAKGSLNTFLNAMTYPDKTVYPVASCNDKDFKNLCDVYMDAVFHPNIYDRPQIFKQEGWHYEVEGGMDINGISCNTEDGTACDTCEKSHDCEALKTALSEMADKASGDSEITINGVVYNEMKGAYSSPDEVIGRKAMQTLYPDTCYANDSGGDPQDIPSLSYEDFIAFHKRYYHPSNSYIYLYGNCDMAERLDWLDQEYLSKYDRIDPATDIKFQQPFDEMKMVEMEYGISAEEPVENNTYFDLGYVVDTVLDRNLYLAFQILDYTLLSAPGAPLKDKLIKEGIGADVMGGYENSIYQPTFSITVKNAKYEDKDRFIGLVRDTLESLCAEGLNKKALEAGINYFEFKYREADFGSYPKGLMYGLQCFDSWLYDETDPFMHISAVSTIEFLKGQIGTGYFEQLIRKYILDNKHCAFVIAKPVRGLTDINDKKLADKLEEYRQSLSEDEVKAIAADTVALKKYQEEPSTHEELLTIPLLEIADIDKKIKPSCNEYSEEDGIRYLFHEVDSNGIGYLNLMFEMANVPAKYHGYVGLLKSLMGMISTENYSYFELANEINAQTGGMSVSVSPYRKVGSQEFTSYLVLEASYLYDKLDFVMQMAKEILFREKLEEHDRIREILMMTKSRFQMAMMSSGHSFAVGRMDSYYHGVSAFNDAISGFEYYRFVDELLADFDNKKEEISKKLREVLKLTYLKANLLVDFGGSRQAYEELKGKIADFAAELSDEKPVKAECRKALGALNEGFKCASQVQYVAMGGDYMAAGFKYNGALKVLKSIMSYEYLWKNVRLLGGAYGGMFKVTCFGYLDFVSYRDPNLDRTLEVYKEAFDYVLGFDVSDRDMRKFIIGTISETDVPRTPHMQADRSRGMFLQGITDEFVQKERDEILSCDVNTIRGLSAYLKAVIDQGYLCVIGSENKVEECKDKFKEVKNLF